MARSPKSTAAKASTAPRAAGRARSAAAARTTSATPKSAQPKTAAADARLRLPSERLNTPTDISPEGVKAISQGLTEMLADFFALYLKTKNFHWHISGPHFRDYHLLLDEQSEQIFAATDDVAERARKIGGTTLRSLGQAAKITNVADNDATYVDPLDMMAELRDDNKATAHRLRELHEVCDKYDDVGTASLIENWIDETERRTWFLYEITRSGDRTGH